MSITGLRTFLSATVLAASVLASAATADDLLKPATRPTTRPAASAPEPPALTHYMGREIAQTMHFAGAPWLTRESRDREEEPAKLMKALNLKVGQTVCDLGCGNGFYTLKLAKEVGPTGKVYAEDIQPEMLTMLEERTKKENLKNIQPVLGTLTDPKLPENSCDLILLVDVYHEIDHPVEMLANIRRSLSPRGRLVLVEFRAEDDNVPIKPLHKMSKPQITKELTANGYKLADQYDDMPWQHVMFFQRDDSWKGPAPAK